MDIIKYLLARKSGISKQFALLWAFDVISIEAGSKSTEGQYLLLSTGGRLLLSGYSADARLKITEGNNE